MAAANSGSRAMRRRRVLTLLVCTLLLGCHRGGSNGAAAVTQQPADIPGVYAASFPCSNCKEIAATLWLRADERFFLRQSYEGDDGTADDASYAFGLWSWDEHAAELVLRGRGPDRRLKRLDSDRLEWLGNAAVKTAFNRDPSAPAFSDKLVFDGESAVSNWRRRNVHAMHHGPRATDRRRRGRAQRAAPPTSRIEPDTQGRVHDRRRAHRRSSARASNS